MFRKMIHLSEFWGSGFRSEDLTLRPTLTISFPYVKR